MVSDRTERLRLVVEDDEIMINTNTIFYIYITSEYIAKFGPKK